MNFHKEFKLHNLSFMIINIKKNLFPKCTQLNYSVTLLSVAVDIKL